MSAERLIPVRSFGELRAGMLVVGKGCPRCNGNHRAMLVNTNTQWYITSENRTVDDGETVWRAMPTPSCSELPVCVTSAAVATGRIFRVDDGLEALDSLERKRPMERMR